MGAARGGCFATRGVAAGAAGGTGETEAQTEAQLELVFHAAAEETLERLQEALDDWGDAHEALAEEYDVAYESGVLTLKLGAEKGTFVLNKQAPNQQIWLSSPVSGPARFNLNRAAGGWIYGRNGATLESVLERELSELCGTPIVIPRKDEE